MDTVNDILEAILNEANGIAESVTNPYIEKKARRICELVTNWNKLADKTVTDCNHSKTREALSDACYAMFKFLKTQNGGFEEMAEALDKAKAALSAPAEPVGNNAKMREALELASRVIHGAIAADILKGDDAQTAFFACRAALAAPPRNCDKYLTPKDAMLAHLEEVYEGEKVEFGDYEWCEFVKWLFAKAKGETK